VNGGPDDAEIAAVLMRLAEARGPERSFCPSEAARALRADWRPLMPEVRRVAADIGLVATQGGVVIVAVCAKGPIRLRLSETQDLQPSILEPALSSGTSQG
jgi:hypothetical protein